MDVGSVKESGNSPVLTTAVEHQTQSLSLFTHLPLKGKLLLVSEGVGASRAPKKERNNVFVLNKTTLPVPKIRKLEPEASATFNPIHLNVPNTQTPIDISEDELTEANVLTFERRDADSKLLSTTLSNISTSQEATTLDPVRDVPRSD